MKNVIQNMKRNISYRLIVMMICLLFINFSAMGQNRKEIDLSGKWNFKLDKGNIGKYEKWFSQIFKETVSLPGTTDENLKGYKNEEVEINSLTRKYKYIGKAWYQREINIPSNWKKKEIKLFLERTKATEVWVDGIYFSQQKSLSAPHIYNLTEALSPGKHILTISVDNTLDLFPVGGSHTLSEHTQTNWNGIIGKIQLLATDKVYIHSVKLYPDIHNKNVRVVFQIKNPDKESIKGELTCKANGFNGNNHAIKKQTFKFSSSESDIVLTETFKVGNDFATWDEFAPNLYMMSANLVTKSKKNSYQDKLEESFGMVDFKVKDTQFRVNNKTIILRGKHDACVFPLTGYPPMTKEEWIRQMKISKEYGINHYRFHSWTPPVAAFEAADIVGIYIQTELPNWRSFEKNDTLHYNYQKKEGENIMDSYGNHPSLVMLSLGNELGGDRNMNAKLVDSFKAYDNRILFAHGSNNYFWDPGVQLNEDFFVSARVKKREDNFVTDIRASFSYIDCPVSGLINGQFPNTYRNFESALKYCKVPAIGHETGQFQVLPNFDEISKYTGVLEARNFKTFKQRMIDKNMFSYWKDLFIASGKHAAMCYKDDNEISMRTKGFGGFQILDLQDFPGQGTALVGMLDAFMDSKGLISPEKWRESCAAQTIQASMPKLVWQNNEEFNAKLIFINYGESDKVNSSIHWELTYQNGKKFNEGKTEITTFKQGVITTAGEIKVPFSPISTPENLILTLRTDDNKITNQYKIWVYPQIKEIVKTSDIVFATKLDKSILEKLQKGEKVFLIPDSASIAQNSTGGLFISDYWCYPMFKGICESNHKPVSPGTLGLLINDQHPVFESFPTSDHSDWQWWSLIKKSHPIILDSTIASYKPIVQPVDNFERCSKLGLLFEFAVGNGKLFVCSIDLSDKRDFVAQNLLMSILTYMDSDKFLPITKISQTDLLNVIYGNAKIKTKSRKTNEKDNTSGYDLLN